MGPNQVFRGLAKKTRALRSFKKCLPFLLGLCFFQIPNPAKAALEWNIQFGGSAPNIAPGIPGILDSQTAIIPSRTKSHGDYVVKTTDGGNTWTRHALAPTNTDAYSSSAAEMVDANIAFVVGSGGKIFKSTDGGITWTSQTSGTTANLTHVSFFDANIGWVVGGEGTLLHTTNGGSTWTSVNTGTTNPLFTVQAPNATTVLIGGSQGVLKRSTDSGNTWTSVYPPGPLLNVYTLFFPNQDLGFMGGQSGLLYRTQDGGLTWTNINGGDLTESFIQLHFSDSNFGAVALADEREETDIRGCEDEGFDYAPCLIRTNIGRADYTQNGGNSWFFTNFLNDFVKIPFVWQKPGINPIALPMENGDAIQFSSDNANTWTKLSYPTASPFNSLIVASLVKNGTTIWAQGYDEGGTASKFFKSEDGGTTWTFVANAPANFRVTKFVFPTANTVVAVADSGKIYRSTDLMNTWTQPTTNIGALFFDVNFLDANTGWAVASGGYVLKTTDGGATWTNQATLFQTLGSGDGSSFNGGIAVLDANTLFVPGRDQIAKSTDGGVTWTAKPVVGLGEFGITNSRPYFSPTNPQKGFVMTAEKDKVFRTVDGGETWTSTTIPGFSGTQGWQEVEGAVYILSEFGLWKTTDVGETFSRITSTTGLNGVSGPGATNFVANGSNLVGGFQSGIVAILQNVFDATPPTTGTVSDQGQYTTNTNTLSASWSGFSDNIGISAYDFSIGTSAGGTQILDWTSNGTGTNFSRNNLTLVNGTTYFINVRAKDAAGNISTVASSDGITVDTSGPNAGTVNDDGTTTASTTALSASWSGFSDTSGISEYSYSIGTSAGGTQLVDWTSNGTNTSLNRNDLTLNIGTTYFINVQAKDAVGNVSSIASSDGITPVDSAAPITGTVLDDGQYTSSTTSLSASWSGFSDAIGITEYSYSIGTSAGGTQLVDWTSNGTNSSLNRTDLSLTNGSQYFINIRARDAAGNVSTIVSTNGITVDSTVPTHNGIFDDGLYTTSTSTLSGSWEGSAPTRFASATDPQSGILAYSYSIGTSAGDRSVLDWTDNGTNLSFQRNGLNLVSGTTYYFNVRAVNGAGLVSEILSSDGITVDANGPSSGLVTDMGNTTRESNQLVVSLSGFSDAVSGLLEYSVSIGTSPGDISVKGWTSVGTTMNLTLSDLILLDQTEYFVNVRASDVAGNISDIVSSDGIRYIADAEGPGIGTVQDEGDSTRSIHQLAATWSGFSDSSGIQAYSVSIGTSPGDDSVKSWTTAGTQTQMTFDNLDLDYGAVYYFNVRAIDPFGNVSAIASSNGIQILTIPGDVDLDGDLDIEDAKLANKIATHSQQPSAGQLQFGDVTEPRDQMITTEDANLILRCTRGLLRIKPEFAWCSAMAKTSSDN